MKIKSIAAVVTAAIIAVSAAGAFVPSSAEAARGGARISSPRISAPAPRTSTPHSSSSSSSSGSTARPNQQYRPSQKASDIPSTAPSARTGSSAARSGASAATNSGTRWGGMLRSIGLFAGGMMLGGLLSSMFGFGGMGFMADFMGLIMNAVIIFAVIKLIMWGVSKFLGRRRDDDPYRSQRYNGKYDARRATIDVDADYEPIEDIKPPKSAMRGKGGTDYEPKRTADWYRSH